ncbi:MAG: hypothetical protein RL497_220 [Pseudomonadota bacterium]|jgi:hypothetical protein
MNRRSLLRYLGLTGLSMALPLAPYRGLANDSVNNKGFFYINLLAGGGWDVTSFCDPKINQPNEKIINNWALDTEVQKAGNISFAPIGNNARFFKQHFDKMLVINGINSRTNAHMAGRLYNNTGSQKNGSPHLSALHAHTQNQGLAMPLMVYGEVLTASLIAPTKLSRDTFQIIDPNIRYPGQSALCLPNDDLATIKALQAERAQNLKGGQKQLAKQQQQINEYYDAVFANTDGFKNYSALYSGLNEGEFVKDNYTDALKFALTAFTSGLGTTADITISGFDTHDNHDTRGLKALDELTNAAGVLWHFAEQLGISERLVVSITSDFARTPFYNDGKGKDHWSYGSMILMQKNAPWANRVVGKTTELHKALKINPQTLQVDANGVELEPSHIHQNLRTCLGVANYAVNQQFKLETTTPVDFLNSTAQTL